MGTPTRKRTIERHNQEKYLVKSGDTATIKGDQTHNLLQVVDLETQRYLQRHLPGDL